jgi:hypothetical protein
MPAPQIFTPKPPLNLFESKRITATDQWQTIYAVPEYVIPATGLAEQQVIATAAIMTGVLVAHDGSAVRRFSARILDADENTSVIVHNAQVLPNDILLLGLDRQVIQTGDALQVRMSVGEVADVQFTYVLNTREVFEEIV